MDYNTRMPLNGMSTIRMLVVVVSVEAKLSFIEPGRRWAHSPSSIRKLVLSCVPLYKGVLCWDLTSQFTTLLLRLSN